MEVFIGVGVSVGGNGENVGIGVAEGISVAVEVAVGIAVCVSAIAVPTKAMAVSIAFVGCVLSVGRKLLQDANITIVRNKGIIVLPMNFIYPCLLMFLGLNAQRFALPALGRGRRSRPARKMVRRRKLLEICAESPASGARFVGRILPEPNFCH